jgi:phosphoglycolate phosphatase
MRAKAVLFDKDGTLLDFQRTWGPWTASVVHELAAGDEALAADMAQAWGLERENCRILPDSVVIAGTVEQVAGAILPFRPDMTLAQMIAFLDKTGAQAAPVPVVPLGDLLDQIAALGLAIGIATNDSEATALAQLRVLGVAQRFDFIAGYDSGHGAKPAPGMCLAFADHISEQPANVVMVGDSAHDLRAGRAAGMRTVAVLTGVAGMGELAPLADVVLPDIGHLPGWLAR